MTEDKITQAKKKEYNSRIKATNAKHAAEKRAMEKRHELELQALERAFGSPDIVGEKDKLH